MILDVGCGKRKMGNINVDIDRNCKPDIICDIHFLPFKNGQFDIVYCYHVLEHEGVKPEKAIAELKRVSRKIVEIQVPHWLSPNAKKDKTHRNFHIMRRKWWQKYNPIKAQTEYTRLNRLVPLPIRPNAITITIRKMEE